MRESVSRPSPHGPQPQPQNARPGSGTPPGTGGKGAQEAAQLLRELWGRGSTRVASESTGGHCTADPPAQELFSSLVSGRT